jgi:GR25 family glycosyltransferase involved in LPS biosynthesis
MEDHRIFRQQMQHPQTPAEIDHLHSLDAAVISLARSPERLTAFRQRFGPSSERIVLVQGVDGQTLKPQALLERGLLSPSALAWPRGQLGCALSHLRCHLRCLRRGRPLLIFEDDALPAPGWEEQLAALLAEAPSDWELLLLGWNLDSCLQLEWAEGVSFTSLFQPRFPATEQLQDALARPTRRQWFRLHKALGLAGYVLSPAGAARLLSWALPLRTLPIQAPELPERSCFSLDGQLNSLYPSLSAWACMPPLVLGANDKPASLTQH